MNTMQAGAPFSGASSTSEPKTVTRPRSDGDITRAVDSGGEPARRSGGSATAAKPTDAGTLDLARWQAHQALLRRVDGLRGELRAIQRAPSISAARNLATLALARLDWEDCR